MKGYKNIKKACRLTDLIFQELLQHFSSMRTEREIYLFLLRQMRRYGVTAAFPPIVANNQHIIHPKARKTRLKKGFCIIDLGVRVHGYCSDMTRTVYIGKPEKKDMAIYNLVLAAEKNSIKRLKIGKPYSELDMQSRKDLRMYKKYFLHSLGHGVGKRIHQRPKISPKSNDNVMINDIITIEPGIYIKNMLGIRIEDTVVVRKNKIEILTRAPKSLITV